MIKITIDTGNDAFQDGNRAREVARILRGMVEQLREGGAFTTNSILDVNGNRVGTITLTGKDRRL